MKFISVFTASCLLQINAATAKSDCQCLNGFDPDAMPKMNVSNFFATAYSNGSSIYSFDVDFWPEAGLASCGATLQGQPGEFVSVWGDQYCWNKANGSYVPVYWAWNQSWPDTGYMLRIDSKWLVAAQYCYECVEFGIHTVSSGDLKRFVQTIDYQGRRNFALRPKTVHG